ncbi:MAG: neutral zinc metallopeptidase [Pseudomonadota bacterium]|nr:neutral zinc metallopeptidase [Pseudomonadota bacterium]
MRLDDERESDQVDDRRSGGMGISGGGLGVGGVVLALAASWFLGIDPRLLLGVAQQAADRAPQQARNEAPVRPIPKEDAQAHFVAKVLASTEDVWTRLFQQHGASYRKPRLVLFSGRTGTACGTGQTAQGPFYCPGDEHVYIDLDFYRELQQRFHAPGEFAQAYVIAHEVGHHVQKLRGTSAKVEQAEQAAGSKAVANGYSVRLELQADCYAGVWGHYADVNEHLLEPGEVEEALKAASAIGDDTLQKQARGYAVPDTFTHGTSAQRVYWFRKGMDSGNPGACNTFKDPDPTGTTH